MHHGIPIGGSVVAAVGRNRSPAVSAVSPARELPGPVVPAPAAPGGCTCHGPGLAAWHVGCIAKEHRTVVAPPSQGAWATVFPSAPRRGLCRPPREGSSVLRSPAPLTGMAGPRASAHLAGVPSEPECAMHPTATSPLQAPPPARQSGRAGTAVPRWAGPLRWVDGSLAHRGRFSRRAPLPGLRPERRPRVRGCRCAGWVHLTVRTSPTG